MRILGLDLGGKRIGVAVSDELGFLAHAVTTVHRRNRNADVAALARLVAEQEAGLVVIGLPLHLNGDLGHEAQKAQKFGAFLAGHLAVPITYWDERLTTVEAARMLAEAGVSPRKAREQIDAAAATVLPQSYLDSHPEIRRGYYDPEREQWLPFPESLPDPANDAGGGVAPPPTL
jgi:putative Holliday junction resolvase